MLFKLFPSIIDHTSTFTRLFFFFLNNYLFNASLSCQTERSMIMVTMSISYSIFYLVSATMLGIQYKVNKYLLIDHFGASIERKQWYLVDHQDGKYREVSLATRSTNYKVEDQGHIFCFPGPSALLSLFFLRTCSTSFSLHFTLSFNWCQISFDSPKPPLLSCLMPSNKCY